jgi:cytochrome P450
MIQLFSEPMRRNPFPLYNQLRIASPILCEPRTGLCMVFDYPSVERVLTDHEHFSSRLGRVQWMNFVDPPRHTKLRALVSRAFTPRSLANLESRVAALSEKLMDAIVHRGAIDLAAAYSIPLPMMVIAEMLGIASDDLGHFTRWNDAILDLSYTVPGDMRAEHSATATKAFEAATSEMNDYLSTVLADRRARPQDDLLTRLADAEIDGERLGQHDILGFFQLLLLAGQETTTNLINNAVLCLLEHSSQLALLRQRMDLIGSAIEEVLRYRSPLQWTLRITKQDLEMPMTDGRTIALPAGKVVLPMIGSANRDPALFRDPERFDITRDPNPHIGFGTGVHFCMGAALARLEARIALTHLLTRVRDLKLASVEPWQPRKALHVHGPTRLPLTFKPA